MECPICNGELINEGPWGYLALHQSGEILGYVYKCENYKGFIDEESANEFLRITNRTLEDMGVDTWEEVTCDSSMHSVSGYFYTYKQGNLLEGYPC